MITLTKCLIPALTTLSLPHLALPHPSLHPFPSLPLSSFWHAFLHTSDSHLLQTATDGARSKRRTHRRSDSKETLALCSTGLFFYLALSQLFAFSLSLSQGETAQYYKHLEGNTATWRSSQVEKATSSWGKPQLVVVTAIKR